MKESACQFGEQRALAGIVTEPQAAASGRAVVLVSAGFTPKYGPFRLYAQLARRLAAHGVRTLRFDLGGIGDSAALYDGRPVEERTQQQISDAIDYMKDRFQLQGVVLAGLCSGADDSFRHAEQDSRVTGVVMIDPFAYRTPGFAWHHLKYRARRRLLRAVGAWRPLPPAGTPGLVDYQHVPQAEARRILGVLIQRQVALHFVYTAGMREHFNHPGQLAAMFPGLDLGERVTLDYLPHLDHTQLFEADRRRLIDAVVTRLAG